MTDTKRPRQPLPDAPRNRDGHPIGSPCNLGCRRPTSAQCHCSTCHKTLRTLSDLVRHRSEGWCLDLEALGLTAVDGLWATPEGHAQREALGDRLREMRAGGEVAADA